MASVDDAAGAEAGDGDGQFIGVSRVPSPVTPNLPVSHHVDKVFTERQGRGGGFTKGKIDPARLLDNLNQAGAAMGLPSSALSTAIEPTMTPVALALTAQKGFRSFGVFSHGFLAGIAFWQLIMVYVLSDYGATDQDPGPLHFIALYSPLAQPLQCIFYLLTVVCTISILDRYDFASFEWSHQIAQMVTLKSGAAAILVYWSGLLLTLSTTNLDDKISLYRTNASIFEAMEPAQLEYDLENWKALNLCRCLAAIIGWVLVSLRPSTDLLQKNLRRLQYNGELNKSQQRLRT